MPEAEIQTEEIDSEAIHDDRDGTFLADLPADVAETLLAGSRRFEVPPGVLLFDLGDTGARVGVLIQGTARVYLTALDGRQLTVRYARRGSIVGKLSQDSGHQAALATKAMTTCVVLELDAERFSSLLRSEVGVALSLVRELIGRLEDTYTTIGDAVFGSMRQRVVRHLLALAVSRSEPNRAVATVTQQQLADGIGATREAVARLLAVLRGEGLVRTAPGEIDLLDVRRLTSMLGEWRTVVKADELGLSFEAQEFLEASPNAIVAVRSDGVIVFTNSAVESTFGWPRDELIGHPVEVLIPERLRSTHEAHRDGFRERPHARAMGLGLDLWGRRYDGGVFPIAASLTTLERSDGILVIATIIDLSGIPTEKRERVPAG